MQRICAALAVLLMAQSTFAGEFNPFLGTVSRDGSAQKPVTVVKTVASVPVAVVPPLPSLPNVSAGSLPYPSKDMRGRQPESMGLQRHSRPVFTPGGRIDDQVVLIDQYGGRSVVQDGSMKSGCFVRYPEVICDPAEIAQARKDFMTEARARAVEEETVSAQRLRIKELSETVVKMREGLNASLGEISEYKADTHAVVPVAVQDASVSKEDARKERDRFNGLAEVIVKLQTDLASAQKDAFEHRSSSEIANAKLAALRTESAKDKTRDKVLADNAAYLQTELADLKKESAESKKTSAAAKTEIAGLKEDAGKEKAQAKKLSASAAETLGDLSSVRREASEYKVANASANTELASLKVQSEKSKGRVVELNKLLGESQSECARLAGANAELTRRLSVSLSDRETIEGLKKKLEAAVVHGMRMDLEFAGLKASVVAPPDWVKGTAKEYKDAALGDVQVSRANGQVFFCVAKQEEVSADHLFGKSVVRKERKGNSIYYALNSNNVRVKE